MTFGVVENLQAYVTLTIAGRPLRCLIDTGFTGHLALPPETVGELDLPYVHEMGVYLADGSVVDLLFHDAVIEWQGCEVDVQVVATGDKAVLGTGLLAGWELRAQFIEGGLVTVGDIESERA